MKIFESSNIFHFFLSICGIFLCLLSIVAAVVSIVVCQKNWCTTENNRDSESNSKRKN